MLCDFKTRVFPCHQFRSVKFSKSLDVQTKNNDYRQHHVPVPRVRKPHLKTKTTSIPNQKNKEETAKQYYQISSDEEKNISMGKFEFNDDMNSLTSISVDEEPDEDRTDLGTRDFDKGLTVNISTTKKNLKTKFNLMIKT